MNIGGQMGSGQRSLLNEEIREPSKKEQNKEEWESCRLERH